MKPIISIIVPVYKAEKYIHKCIQSVLEQTFKSFELILIDDGSPDACPEICDNYALCDNRVTVIHTANKGVSSARNTGIRLAQGKYLMFLDSDDYIHNNACELFYEAISSNPSSWILCNMCRVNENNNIISEVNEIEALDKFNKRPTYFSTFQLSLSGSVSNKIYSKDIIRTHNLFFDESRTLGEDVLFDITYCQLCSDIVFIPKPLYFYRVVDGSLTHTYHPDHLGVYIKLFGIRLPLIKEDEIPEFCDTYFYYFTNLMKNTLDKRNPMTFIQKMRYNHKMMNTKEFIFCSKNATGKNDSPLYMRIARMHNYYLFWMFLKICDLKQLLHRKTGEQ